MCDYPTTRRGWLGVCFGFNAEKGRCMPARLQEDTPISHHLPLVMVKFGFGGVIRLAVQEYLIRPGEFPGKRHLAAL